MGNQKGGKVNRGYEGALTGVMKENNWGLEAQITALRLKFNPRASKLTKHRSLALSWPLPLSPSDTYIYSHRGNGFR